MGTLVSFHAHPDDEAIATGGTLARAAAEGHRTVVVFATRGEHGEVPEGFLAPGEELWRRREMEVDAAARALKVQRVEYLGYVDSGMMGTATNDAPGSFWRADVQEASERLALLLEEESADVLTVYDPDGSYGHPDHIQVHRVGVRAAERAGTARVYESTFDRGRVLELLSLARAGGLLERLRGAGYPDEEEIATLGLPSEEITTRVDVTGYLDQKRAAMMAHASQISESSFFLALPAEWWRIVWGEESYRRRGAEPGTSETWLF